ncbi:MAG: sugar transferase [Candidatus Microgenomates bacterium]
MIERIFAGLVLIFLSPLFLILYVLVKLDSKGPFLFTQKRAGKGKKPFCIYKIRTMVEKAEKLKSKYLKYNQADGPVFKIYDDPRYTKVGKWLARFGIDELPQFINILKGEMSLVGPRPLPVEEAQKIPKKYEKRFSVKPGIFSSWVASGAFHNDFDHWMKLDIEDVENKGWWWDVRVFLRSIKFVVVNILKKSINFC